MLEDQTFTARQRVVEQPGTCMQCHASVYVPYRKLGGGDLTKGFELMNRMPYAEARKLVTHPIACIDCHDPTTMQLRVTRPGFLEGIRALKASQGVQNYDVNATATRQEMRSYVCGQCHVEYYFQGAEKRLVYPWAKGIKVENILAYYEENQHKDWTHAGLRNRAMDTLVALIGDLKAAREAGTSGAGLDQALKLQRYAQFMLDFVEAVDSTGFHAPQEAERILAESIDDSPQGQPALRGAAVPGVP